MWILLSKFVYLLVFWHDARSQNPKFINSIRIGALRFILLKQIRIQFVKNTSVESTFNCICQACLHRYIYSPIHTIWCDRVFDTAASVWLWVWVHSINKFNDRHFIRHKCYCDFRFHPSSSSLWSSTGFDAPECKNANKTYRFSRNHFIFWFGCQKTRSLVI